MSGTLYVVATPLGNLQDLTLRASEVLRRVPLVVAEDTRRTRQLLAHLDTHPRLLSYHAHSDPARLSQILDRLSGGQDVALVSDAGTPVVSDPGAELVAAARSRDIAVHPVPGVSAVTAALSASGMPGDRYHFLGFPPRKGKDRNAWITRALTEPDTIVCFEAPGRTGALLADLAREAPERRAVIARELTKLHEEFVEGSLGELAGRYRDQAPRGEVTIVIAGNDDQDGPETATGIEERAAQLLAEGVSSKMAVAELVREFGVPRNQAYRMVVSLGD